MIKLFKNKYFRTLFLAFFATLTFVGSAIFIFDVEPRVMLNFFLASVVIVVCIILAALLLTSLRYLIKRWF